MNPLSWTRTAVLPRIPAIHPDDTVMPQSRPSISAARQTGRYCPHSRYAAREWASGP